MKRQVKIIAGVLLLYFVSSFACAQDVKDAATANMESDSAELKVLIVKLLRWHDTDKQSDFVPLLQHPTDRIYTGIDWQSHKQRVAALEKTDLFTKDFLDNYQKIALHLDAALKQNKTKYTVGDLPPYGNEANEWCNCQDYPANMLKRLQITALKINENVASFKWTWGNKFFYAVRAKKENNVWKIAALERFNISNFTW